MSLKLNDATASTQRMAFDNSGNTEFGSATPSSNLSFAGNTLLAGSDLAQATAAPPSMVRVTGLVDVTGGQTATIQTGTLAGFGSASGKGGILSVSTSSFTLWAGGNEDSPSSLSYSVF